MSWVPVRDGSVCCPQTICGQGDIAVMVALLLFPREQGRRSFAKMRDVLWIWFSLPIQSAPGRERPCSADRTVTGRSCAVRCPPWCPCEWKSGRWYGPYPRVTEI